MQDVQSRISMAKAAFIKKKKMLFTRKLDLNVRKKLLTCHIWSVALYGAETWQLLKIDQKYLKSFEIWCWRSTEVILTDRVRNEALRGIKEERISYLQ